jgi:hypothetical protein
MFLRVKYVVHRTSQVFQHINYKTTLTRSPVEWTMIAPVQLLRKWYEERPSIKSDPNSSVTELVGRMSYAGVVLLLIPVLCHSSYAIVFGLCFKWHTLYLLMFLWQAIVLINIWEIRFTLQWWAVLILENRTWWSSGYHSCFVCRRSPVKCRPVDRLSWPRFFVVFLSPPSRMLL